MSRKSSGRRSSWVGVAAVVYVAALVVVTVLPIQREPGGQIATAPLADRVQLGGQPTA